MTSKPGQRKITIHILLTNSRSKDKQTMKFGQLIEYNMRNNFLGIIHKMWWRNYSHTLFQKIKIEHISGSIV